MFSGRIEAIVDRWQGGRESTSYITTSQGGGGGGVDISFSFQNFEEIEK